MAAPDLDRGASERLSRLRWRMRGAWLWPVFVVLTAVDGVVLRELPFYDGAPDDLYGALLVAGFSNLVAVVALAPPLAWALRRGRPDMPREVARNYAGTALVCAIAVALVAGGIAHRPAVREAERELAVQFAAVRDYVSAHAPEYAPGLGAADALRLEPGLYRTCVPGPQPRRPLCLVVSTERRPPGIRRDTDRTPNSAFRAHGGFD